MAQVVVVVVVVDPQIMIITTIPPKRSMTRPELIHSPPAVTAVVCTACSLIDYIFFLHLAHSYLSLQLFHPAPAQSIVMSELLINVALRYYVLFFLCDRIGQQLIFSILKEDIFFEKLHTLLLSAGQENIKMIYNQVMLQSTHG